MGVPFRHFDPESQDWYDLNLDLGATPDDIKRQIADQKMEREMQASQSAGSMIERGMESARNWMGDFSKKVDPYIQNDPMLQGLTGLLGAGSQALIHAPQVAIDTVKNMVKPPEMDRGEFVPRDPIREAAQPVMDEIGSRSGMENIGRSVPDLAAMFTPMAGPVYGAPALEHSETAFKSGHPVEGALNMALAAGAGAGGLHTLGKPGVVDAPTRSRGMLLDEAPVEMLPDDLVRNEPTVNPAIPENLLREHAQLEESLATGHGGEAAIARLTELEDRIQASNPPEIPLENNVQLYSGGGGDFWSTDPKRAASYGDVRTVSVPQEVFEAGKVEAAKRGQPTKWDTVLPDEWVKRAEEAPDIQPDVYEATDTGQSIDDILKELDPYREPYQKPEVQQIDNPVDVQMAEPPIEPKLPIEPKPTADELIAIAQENAAKNPVEPAANQAAVDAAHETMLKTEAQPVIEAKKPTWAEFVAKAENKGKKPKQLKLEFDSIGQEPPKPIVPKPKGEGPKPESFTGKELNPLESWMKPVIHNLGKVDPELGKAARGYLNDKAALTGDFIAYSERATKDFTPAEKDIVRQLLEGEIEDPKTVDPKVFKGFETLRNILETAYNISEKVGLKPQHRSNYFPHMFEKGKGAKPTVELDPFEREAFGPMDNPNLEAREKGRKDYIKDIDVALNRYFRGVAGTISEAKNFGLEWEFPRALVKDMPRGFTSDYIRKSMKRLTGRAENPQLGPIGSKVSGGLRHAQALSSLGLAQISQIGQIANTAAYGGWSRSLKALGSLVTKAGRENTFVRAMASGALEPDVALELGGTSRGAKAKSFMWGVGKADRAMRVHAFKVGEFLAEEAKAGKTDAIKVVKDMGLDPEKASTAEIARQLSDKTQFRAGVGEKPLWASSDLGKMVFQFQHFAYRQGILIGEATKDLGKYIATAGKAGDYKPIARLTATGVIAGEVVNDLKELIRGKKLTPEEKDTEWDDNDWKQNLKAAMRNRRIPLDSPGWRAFQNFNAIGGLGILQSYLENLATERDVTALAGPVARNLTEGGDAALQAVQGRGTKPLTKWGIGQIPVFGRDIAREVTSEGTTSRSRRTRRRRTR